jgi:hypothetical protein
MKAKQLTGIENMLVDNYIGLHEEELFTKVIQIAEKEGKSVRPIVIPTNNIGYAIAETACELNAKEVYLGISEKYPPEYQLEQFALFWGRTQPDENKQITVKAIGYKNNNKFELCYEL